MHKVVLRNQKKKINSLPQHDAQHDIQKVDPVVISQDRWQKFIGNVRSFDDLVLVTMFQEAQFIGFDEAKCIVSVSFLKKFTIFQDILEKEKQRWLIILQNIYGHQVQLQSNFELVVEQKKQFGQQERVVYHTPSSQPSARVVGNKLDLSDATKWKLAHELMKHFDGVIMEISGDKNE